MIPRLRRQAGQALPMVIGMMMFFSITVTTVIVYSSSQDRAADKQKKTQYAGGAAEAALNTAIDVLGNSVDPTASSALPACPTTTPLDPAPPGAAGDYCGTLFGSTWTITARGWPTTTGVQGQVKTRTITQTAVISPLPWGGLGELWNRLYQYDTATGAKCATFKKMIVTVPVVSRGCITLQGDDAHPARLLGSYVSAGGNVTLKDQDSIGMSDSPIGRADIAGTCTIEHGTGAHSPCGPIDGVYASAIGTAPDLTRPAIDFVNAYSSAKPGPMQNCTVGSLPSTAKFDKNTTYNRDNPAVQLTPADVSYSCQVWSSPPSSGTLLGEISWDSANQILTVNGTVFFDGDVKLTAPGHSKACGPPPPHHADPGPFCDKSLSYNGRGMLYASGKLDLEEGLCSGGDGSNDCETDPPNWDPTQNLLILVSGGLKNIGEDTFTMLKDEAVFQGAVWSVGRCKIGVKASVSAPLICGELGVKDDDTVDDPTVNPWPDSLISPRTGQVLTNPTGEYTVLLGPEYGG